MVTLLAISYVAIGLVDWLNLIDLRTLVYSFLLSKRNKKGALKIHRQQSKKDRFTLSYIRNYTIYPRAFDFFQHCRIAYALSIVPMWLLIIIACFFSIKTSLILSIVMCLIKFCFGFFIIHSQFSTQTITRFDKRY